MSDRSNIADTGGMTGLPAAPHRSMAEATDISVPPTEVGGRSMPSKGTAAAHATPFSDTLVPTSQPTGPSAEVSPINPGNLLDAYEILGEIARGGMGVVYKARHKRLGRIVAVKMILPHMLQQRGIVERFYIEARAAAALDHPNIVPIYEIGESNGTPFFTMAFVEGESLKHRVARGGLSIQEAVRIFREVAQGLAAAHQRGIIHRDLKPENVLIDAQGRPRITDFGLAKEVAAATDLTAKGETMGTPAFMSPEQALGGSKRTIGPAADVYSMGAILFDMLAGRPPFVAETVTELLYKVVSEPAPPLDLFKTGVPASLERICLKCLAKDPAERYPTAEELRIDLVEWERNAGATEAAASENSPRPADESKIAATRRVAELKLISTPTPAKSAFKSRLAGFGAVALIAALVWFAAGKPKEGSWKPETPPVAGADGESLEAPVDDQVIPLIEPERKDFGLKVEMLSGVQDQEGVWQLKNGDRARIRIEADRDAYVGVWTLDAGGTVMQLFPHGGEQKHFLKAGEPRTVPGEGYEIVVSPSTGIDQVWIIASTRAWDPIQGAKEESFTVFKDARERNRFMEQTRGMRLQPKGVLVAEEAIRYRVSRQP